MRRLLPVLASAFLLAGVAGEGPGAGGRSAAGRELVHGLRRNTSRWSSS